MPQIQEGQKLPGATFIRISEDGPQPVALNDLMDGRKIVLFAVPGAFTPTCHSAHMPSFIRTKDRFAEKGVDEIVCVSVNDPFVLRAWATATGADEGGITVLADPEGAFTQAIGMEFDAPPVGLLNRSKRYAMLVDDGTVVQLREESSPGECDISGGESLLEVI
ncbi:MAG: peroxiredoxin [Hasllibacter sp.]